MFTLSKQKALHFKSLCYIKRLRTLGELYELIHTIYTHKGITLYWQEGWGKSIIEMDKIILEASMRAVQNEKLGETAVFSYDEITKKKIRLQQTALSYIEDSDTMLTYVFLDREQLINVGMILNSPQYIPDEQWQRKKENWNNIEYFTFQQIKAQHTLNDADTIIHIESLLENKMCYAYYKHNNYLEKYTGVLFCNEKKPTLLPFSKSFLRFRWHEYHLAYTKADHLMFFHNDLLAHEMKILGERLFYAPDSACLAHAP